MEEKNLTGESGNVVSGGTSMPSEPKNKNSFLEKVLAIPKLYVAIGVVVVLLAAVIGVGIYKVYSKTSSDKFSLVMAKVLNLPAVKVSDEKVPYVSFLEDLKAIHTMRDYDKAQRDTGVTPERSPGADLSEEQMTDQVLWRLVNNSLVEKAARQYGVTVEDDDIKNLKVQMLQQFKDEADANTELTKRYGWDLSVYEKKVMRPFILQTKLAQKIKDDPKTKEDLKIKAEQVLEQVKKGEDFAGLAKQYNTDSTAAVGGSLGWFGKGEMVPEFEKAAYSLKKGEIHPTLVESTYGYHIIRLDDRKTEKVKDANGKTVSQEKVNASQILFRFPDLLSFIDKEVKEGKIHLYLNIHNPFAEANSSSK